MASAAAVNGAPHPMRIFHVHGDRFDELTELPDALPAQGFVWIGSARREFEVQVPVLQARLQRWGVGPLVDLHIADLLNAQLPSHFDHTSWYDLMVFRRLAAGPGSQALFLGENQGSAATAREALAAIDTSPVGFAVYDRVLLSVHPTDCAVRDHYAQRLHAASQSAETRGTARLPASPADLMLRMVNHMVDGYLDLRRLLSRQFSVLQQELLNPRSRFDDWALLLESRNALHLLEDICEDQRSAVQEWIDAMDEWPAEDDPAARRERDLLRVRSRDVLEHVERVLGHVRRLEQSAETAVQMHFSALSHRTNDIMRTLTTLTAIFLPLNLITGFFGMNFEFLPLIHSETGFWVSFAALLGLGAGLVVFFRRKRYLGTRR
jgi:Mg2+ and Co2+ transporter CorA